ncbi:glycyl-radical enzyme activating protein [Persicobacter diffluens]|uniref:Glycyl-radical enzyme activating protein n=1 Tax=Persicobacter diffluens TaxID=981 RepID=A0AAN4W533_9BACT|nr:glycyl-radical enzyme activating protein [Persicobacter diffluens]
MEAVVFDIQRFSLTNGPGIRTTVFLKGCPLSCKWCHNPESQKMGQGISIDFDQCVSCGACASACEREAHPMVKGKHEFDQSSCQLDGHCVEACPKDVIKIWGNHQSIEEVMEVLLKDIDYYKNSDGGITFSGGEPMSQFPFLLEVCKRLHALGIAVCLDTSGQSSLGNFKKILPYISLIHFDIKSLDAQKHKEATGVVNHTILENLQWLGQQACPIVLRCPTIPEFNDSEEDIKALSELANSLPAVQTVDILPYHTMGIHKAEQLIEAVPGQLQYQVPSQEDKSRYAQLLKQYCQKEFTIGK